MKQQSDDEGKQSEAMRVPTRVAVLGYGPEAREQAMRLRAQGHEVAVGVRSGGMSWVRASKDGFTPKPTAGAVEGAEVVVMLVPDEDQPSLFWKCVAPCVAKGALLVVGRGHALYTGAVEPPPSTDVVLVTASASIARSGCRVAVHQDASGRALDRAVAYARAAFGPLAATLGTTTVGEEVEADLAALEERVGGAPAVLAEIDEVLARGGTHEPDEAKLGYYARLRDLIARRHAASGARPVATPTPAPSSSSAAVVALHVARVRGVA